MSRRLRFGGLVSALFICWVLSAPWMAHFLVVEERMGRADAIVVLAGSATYRERTMMAAELYAAGLSGVVILTNDQTRGGWVESERRNTTFAERARQELRRLGVADRDIEVLNPPVASTREEARVIAEHVAARKLSSVCLVTSAYHSRRALQTIRKEFDDRSIVLRVGLRHPPPGIETPPVNTWWLYPDGWRFVAMEYVKMAYYFVIR